jgi:dihydropteroate synthase
MGIVNVTPDSFSDGGANLDPATAVKSALRAFDQGAAIADVGGESTRPGADVVPEDVEAARVLPVIESFLRERPDAAISVDTYKARVAARALDAGALIVNDVSCCSFEPELLDVVAQYKPGYVLMHSQGRPRTMQDEPRYGSVLAEVARFFELGLARLVTAGVPEDRIVLDPGIGFGKTFEHNLTLLRGLPFFLAFGRPLMLGVSNKSLFGKLLGLGVHDREGATQAATALAYAKGALIHRVHSVNRAVQALALARAMA